MPESPLKYAPLFEGGPTRRTRLRWNWKEIIATSVVCLTTVLLTAAMFYGFSL